MRRVLRRVAHKTTTACRCLLLILALLFAVSLAVGVLAVGGLAMCGLSLVILHILQGKPLPGQMPEQLWESWFAIAGLLVSLIGGLIKVFQDPEISDLVGRLKLELRALLGRSTPQVLEAHDEPPGAEASHV